MSAVRYTTPLFALGLTVAVNRIVPHFVPDDSGGGLLFRRAALRVGILIGVILIRV